MASTLRRNPNSVGNLSMSRRGNLRGYFTNPGSHVIAVDKS
ncbi:uncharacterized protein FTOL_10092 [Fusarium torulosum]|uniref:Uncharacterized protein n=1 Tax=Fusarium torulosum TaxID=33205 RepID=A0AAE8SM03_9HYPO|nr:uncharacterized protein FTOL_10092 [Fusarium torulosum]